MCRAKAHIAKPCAKHLIQNTPTEPHLACLYLALVRLLALTSPTILTNIRQYIRNHENGQMAHCAAFGADRATNRPSDGGLAGSIGGGTFAAGASSVRGLAASTGAGF